MTKASLRLSGATSLMLLGALALLPMPVQGEVATAQIAPEVVPTQQIVEELQPPAAEAPAVEVEVLEQEEDAQPKKLLGEGVASYYGNELAGNRTASGERFNPKALTAAHRTLPMGTKLRVTNQSNGKSVIVRVNDRGPFAKARIIDLSHAAAQQIAMVRSGTARVKIELADAR